MSLFSWLFPRPHPFRADTFPKAKADVAAYAQTLSPQSAAFVVEVFDRVAEAVSKRRLVFPTEYWVEIGIKDSYEDAAKAFCKLDVLKPFLEAHGLVLKAYSGEINIDPVKTPPPGSLGEVLRRNKDAYDARKRHEREQSDREWKAEEAARAAAKARHAHISRELRGNRNV